MKKNLATGVLYLGVAITMLGGARWPVPHLRLVGAGITVLVVGVLIKRRVDREAPPASAGESGTVASAARVMPALLTRARALAAIADDAAPGHLAREIEALHADGIELVAAAQEDFVRRYGFVGYASFMAPLATGERLLHRAWSAASDGHSPEAIASLHQALPYLNDAALALALLAVDASAELERAGPARPRD